MDEAFQLSEKEAWDFLERLFPHGFAGKDVLREIAPDGWERSPLVRAYHPTLEQWHRERLAFHENTARLHEIFAKRREDGESVDPPGPPPTFEESRRDFEETPVNADRECRDIVGAVAWEVFSDNHSVIAEDGREVSLGSFRGTGAFLDEFDRGRGQGRPESGESDEFAFPLFDSGGYMRFYMGLAFNSDRCDYGSVYRMLFRRLRGVGADWVYRFPRIGIVRFDRGGEADSTPEDYDPSAAFAAEQEREKRDEEVARMEAELDASYREAAEEAAKKPPPPVVQAYRAVYHRLPEGWPPA
ncbi:MAG: hypothetical protein JJU00_07450 [Opitutales bacterium]|nr:hypothetical protein [Opitutales bacterium]